MPSHGFFLRHVNGIQFDNVEIRTQQEDLRPVFVLNDVHDADFFRIRVPKAAGVPVFAMHDISDFTVHMCSGVPDTQLKSAKDQKL